MVSCVGNTSCLSTLPALPSVNVDLPQEVPSGCPGLGMYSWSYHSPKIWDISLSESALVGLIPSLLSLDEQLRFPHSIRDLANILTNGC